MGVPEGISDGKIAKVEERRDAVTAREEIRRIMMSVVRSKTWKLSTNGKKEEKKKWNYFKSAKG